MSRIDNDAAYFRAKRNAKKPLPASAPYGSFRPMAEPADAPPETSTALPAAKMTRQIGGVRGADYNEDQVRATLKQKESLRRRVIQAALATNDPEQRQALIAQRGQIEQDIRPLGESLPRTVLTPEGAQRSREDMRAKLAAARAGMAPKGDDGNGMDAALAAGTKLAGYNNPSLTTPMSDPRDEVFRRQVLRLKANDPTLVGNTLTTPARMEADSRRQTGTQERKPEEVFPDVSADEAKAINQRYYDAVDRQGPRAAGTDDVMKRDAEAKAHVRMLQQKQMEAEKASAQRAVDFGGVEDLDRQMKIEELRNKRYIADIQNRGAREDADRSAPTTENLLTKDNVGRLEAMIPEIVNPGIQRAGWGGPEERDRVVGDVIKNIKAAVPKLTPAQRAEYANRLRSMYYTLTQERTYFGRGDYREKYAKEIESLLSDLGQ